MQTLSGVLEWAGQPRPRCSRRDMLMGLGLLAASLGTSACAAGLGAVGAPPSAAGGQGAPDFTVSLIGGGTFSLAQQRGKPVLILFTASWCDTCIPEVNKMAQLQQEFGGRGLRQLVLSVDRSDTEAQFAGLRQKTSGANLLWALDPGLKATLAYQVKATDTKVLVDPHGQVAFRTMGSTSLETLRQHIAPFLS